MFRGGYVSNNIARGCYHYIIEFLEFHADGVHLIINYPARINCNIIMSFFYISFVLLYEKYETELLNLRKLQIIINLN